MPSFTIFKSVFDMLTRKTFFSSDMAAADNSGANKQPTFAFLPSLNMRFGINPITLCGNTKLILKSARVRRFRCERIKNCVLCCSKNGN